MQKTTKYSNGVIGIITRARNYDSNIGNYVDHFINDRMSFTVRLSYGRIEIPMETAQDHETMPSSISEERVQNIARYFQSNNPKPIGTKTVVIEEPKIINTSLWQRLLKFLGMK